MYWPSSTRFGSTRIIRTWSGVARMRIDVISELMHDDLPAPVAPEMRTCGICARLTRTARPAMSRPSATSSGCVAWCASSDVRMSPSETSCRCRFGTSTPIADLPGIGARMRTSGDAIAYAMSFDRLVTRATLTPGPSSSSNRVTVGPTVRPTNRVSTPWADNADTSDSPAWSSRRRSCRCSFDRLKILIGGSCHAPVTATGASGPATAGTTSSAPRRFDATGSGSGSVSGSSSGSTVGTSPVSVSSSGRGSSSTDGGSTGGGPPTGTVIGAASPTGSSSTASRSIRPPAHHEPNARPSAATAAARPRPSAPSETPVDSTIPTNATATRITTAPAVPTPDASGRPTATPSHPPASLNARFVASAFGEPPASSASPHAARSPSTTPIHVRTGSGRCRPTMITTPTTTQIGGRRKRIHPTTAPSATSTPWPTVPAASP